MKFKPSISIVLAVLAFGAPALAQEERLPFATPDTGDSEEMKAYIVHIDAFEKDEKAMQFRGGGTSGKQLGVYREAKGGKNYDFHSKEYLSLDPAIQARWVATLHNFIVERGGGYDNYAAYTLQWERTHPNQAVNALNADLSKSGTAIDSALAATYVPYNEVEGYADVFFRQYAKPDYAPLGGVWADWFKNDAILDAVNLWSLYQDKKKVGSANAGQDLLGEKIWTNATLERYKNRLGEEGKNINGKPVPPLRLPMQPPGPTTAPFRSGALPQLPGTLPQLPGTSGPFTTPTFPSTLPGEEPVKHIYVSPFAPKNQALPEGEGMKKLEEELKKQGQ